MSDVYSQLKSWQPSYVGHSIVLMPPTWERIGPMPYTFVFVTVELEADGYCTFYKVAKAIGLVNPRLFTPQVLSFASLFHPGFFYAIKKFAEDAPEELRSYLSDVRVLKLNWVTSPRLTVASTRYWLQSMIFLSGVTLSAAIVQNRWSKGTLVSKLNRLWQAQAAAEKAQMDEFNDLQLREFIEDTSKVLYTQPLHVLSNLKTMYGDVLKSLVSELPFSEAYMTAIKLTGSQQERFGFVAQIRTMLGSNLNAVILYGSATNSEKFSDYDVIIVVKDIKNALNKLAGQSPKFNGLELNISVYGEEDFWIYQLASGDNLMDHGLCLYGEARVPNKSREDLMARNFSFGYIRFRQLLGIAAHVSSVGSISAGEDDKRNLIDYFLKIPLNVGKGIQGCIGEIHTNEQIKGWAEKELMFNIESERSKVKDGNFVDPIATSAWATQKVLQWYNRELKFCGSVRNHEQKINTDIEI